MHERNSEPLAVLEASAQLLQQAREAAQGAYAPYSGFRVGAVVLSASGALYRGANVENASYALGICAERVALAAARVAGETELMAIAAACIDAPADAPMAGRMPCGACRQWIAELAPQARIFIDDANDSFGINELLPNAFQLDP